MAKRRNGATLFAILLFFTTACAWPSPERQLLIDFFQACSVYDTTVLARLGTASCNPRTDGVVQQFDIESVEQVAGPQGRLTRNVTIMAQVRPLGGTPTPQLMAVMLEQMEGRWIVAAVTPLRASRTSPEASSAPPK